MASSTVVCLCITLFASAACLKQGVVRARPPDQFSALFYGRNRPTQRHDISVGDLKQSSTSSATPKKTSAVTPPFFTPEESWPGSCRLRSKRFISDGLCTSTRPIAEVVCAESCVMNAWAKTGARPLPWRCEDGGWRRKKIKLLCRDGSTRFYRIRIVQSCRCIPRHHHSEERPPTT